MSMGGQKTNHHDHRLNIEMQDHKMLCMQKVLGWSQFDDFSPEAGAAAP